MPYEETVALVQFGDVAVMRVLPASITPEAGEALLSDRSLAKGKRVILDLSSLLFLGSAGLSVMLACLERAREGGGRLVIAGLGAECEAVLRVSGLNRILDLFPDVPSALEALGSGESVRA